MSNGRLSITMLCYQYDNNPAFKEYVDKVCEQDNCTVVTALQNKIVEEYCLSVMPGGCNAE